VNNITRKHKTNKETGAGFWERRSCRAQKQGMWSKLRSSHQLGDLEEWVVLQVWL
jgi:hypothetical protein